MLLLDGAPRVAADDARPTVVVPSGAEVATGGNGTRGGPTTGAAALARLLR